VNNGGTSVLLAIALAAAVVLVSAPAPAQVAGATVSGTVKTTSGTIVPQAQIALTNVMTEVVTNVIANSDGFYSVPNLLPGSYKIAVSGSGFSTEVRSDITLTVGALQLLNFTLHVGAVNQTIQVSGAPPAVELASSTIGDVVNSDAVVDLPLNGRDWTQLATLQAGVNTIPTQPSDSASATNRASRGYGAQLTISGTRPEMNNYRLDGISIVDYAGGSPGSVLGIALGVDAIAEFSVLTSNYTAEYGRTSGGVINAITRSGTDQIHGDAYWFLRDGKLDARNYFDSTTLPFHRNQFGASVGGPIQRNKTFFFVDYEGLREDTGITNVNNVPSMDSRNGILHNADGTTTVITVDPLIKPYLAFYPLPNAGLLGTGNTGLFNVAVNSAGSEDFETVRIDRKLSSKDSISGTWFYDKGLNTQPDALNNLVLGNTSARQMIGAEETHVFSSTLVNSLRGGFSRIVTDTQKTIKEVNPLTGDTSLGSFAGRAAPQITVSGLAFMVGGVEAPTHVQHAWNSFQAYDDAFLTEGLHSVKFGIAFERMQHNFIIPTRANGAFTFGSLESFLTNQPKTFVGSVPETSSNRGIRQSLFGIYIQDDWRLRSDFTLNLGLRYEMVTVPTEVQNKLSNLLTFASPTPQLGSPYFTNPTRINFEPRVGFSWDPFHNGKTAVRGAFGLFDVLPLNYEFLEGEDQSAPFAQIITTSNLAAGSFPTKAASLENIDPSKFKYTSLQPRPPRNYVMIWNLNVQRDIAPNTTMMVGYVGNKGVHMLNRADDVNSVVPTNTSQGLLFPFPAGSGTRINPHVGDVLGLYWNGDAEYDALQVQVTKRMSHGFQVQGSYTWGKGIDTGSASTQGDTFANSISSLFWFCKPCRRGPSDFNIAQTLVLNSIWRIPGPSNWGTLNEKVLGGWQLGGIFTAQGGVPITPLIGGDPLGLNSSDPYAFPNRKTGSGCQSPVNPGKPNNYVKLNCFTLPTALPPIAANCTPFGSPNAPILGTCANLVGNAGRNSVIGPGLVDLDMSLFKNNYIKKISETFNVQFRAEFFNSLNRANFATPVDNETLFDQNGNQNGGAGSVDQTSTPAREIQFAVKVIW
jgi:hypothetical protein